MSWTKLGVVALVIAVVLTYWMTHAIWAASFLGVLFALSLTGPASWLRTKVPMPHWLAASLVMLVVVIVIAAVGLAIGPSLARQNAELRTKLPAATEQVVDWLDERPWGKRLVDRADEWLKLRPDADPDPILPPDLSQMIIHGFDSALMRPHMVSRESNAKDSDDAASADATAEARATEDEVPDDEVPEDEAAEDESSGDEQTAGRATDSVTPPEAGGEPAMTDMGSIIRSGAGVVNMLIITVALITLTLFLTVFIAFDPKVYERGILWLVPRAHETLAQTTMNRLAVALRWWMLGRLISMFAVAVLTSLGMWIIGMPAPIALGVLAGVLSFVPNIGPIVAGVPGVLLALTLGPWMVVWAICVYVVAQAIESNAITPIVNQYAVSTPAGLVLVAQFVFAILGGVWGMIIATPALVVIMVLVQQLYVREVLKKRVEVIGST